MTAPLDVFNARNLRPDEVARSFIPPAQFGDVVGRWNTLLVGPRGSGKTTLLKMLMPGAMDAWGHADAAYYREQMDYASVFVPTDVLWREQLRSIQTGLDPMVATTFAFAVFTTNLLIALVESMRAQTGRLGMHSPLGKVELAPSAEDEFVASTARRWHLTVRLRSLEGLQHALDDRLQELSEHASIEAMKGPAGQRDRIAEARYLFLDFLLAAKQGVRSFDQALGIRSRHWALCFDELELESGPIFGRLLSFFRSVDDSFVFKLSCSPFRSDIQHLVAADAPARGQDHRVVSLTYPRKEQGYRFTRELLGRFVAPDAPPSGLEKALGRSLFEPPPEGSWKQFGTAYGQGGPLADRFEGLWDLDPSFQRYLAVRGVHPLDMGSITDNKRAAVVRKVTSLVVVREHYMREAAESRGGTTVRFRSRKNRNSLYAGAPTVLALTEGNPRLIVALGSAIKAHSRLKGGRPTPAIQGRIIDDIQDAFVAYLQTVPVPYARGEVAKDGLMALVEPIGEYFSARVLRRPFEGDPPTSFEVDADVGPEIDAALGVLENAGAIVRLSDFGPQGLAASTLGARYRLSYLLAPIYRLPLTFGRAVSWSSIRRSKFGEQLPLQLPTETGG